MNDDQKNELTDAEKEFLARLESQMKIRLSNKFANEIEFGDFLSKIKEDKLFRPHRSIAEYAATVWDLSAQDTHRMINGAKVVNVLEASTVKPTNLAQTEELKKLDDDQMKEVWKQVVHKAGNKRITAGLVSEVANPKPTNQSSEDQETPKAETTWTVSVTVETPSDDLAKVFKGEPTELGEKQFEYARTLKLKDANKTLNGFGKWFIEKAGTYKMSSFRIAPSE